LQDELIGNRSVSKDITRTAVAAGSATYVNYCDLNMNRTFRTYFNSDVTIQRCLERNAKYCLESMLYCCCTFQ